MEARASATFIGRVPELEELGRALDEARSGRGTTVLVAGEAGIGKTRLAAELATRARDAGFDVRLGRSIDLVGTDLPYQPFVEALRPLAELRPVDGRTAGSQLRVFEETLAMLTDHAAEAPVLLVLEDLHWADTSTLDLVVFLAHNLADRRVLLLATYRADELSSAERMRRLADGVRRSGSALLLDLGPLAPEELSALLAAHTHAPTPAALSDAIIDRSEGNPFFAEELLAAADGQSDELPRGLRDLLLQRVARLDRPTQSLLRLAAAAGRDVGYPLLLALAALPESAVRESLRLAVEHGVLVAVPGDRQLPIPPRAPGGGDLLDDPARRARGAAREAGRRARAQRSRVGGGARAALGGGGSQHRRAGRVGRGGTRSGGRLRTRRGARAPRAGARPLARGAGRRRARPGSTSPSSAPGQPSSPAKSVPPHARSSSAGERSSSSARATRTVRPSSMCASVEYLEQTGSEDACLAAVERAVELVPAEPPSAGARVCAGGHSRGALGVAWRRAESLPVCEQALALARVVGAREAEVRALTVRGSDLAYLGRGEEGVADLRRALELAEEIGDHIGLERAWISSHRCADDAGTAPRVGATSGRRGSR